eukprot:4777809-Karenia_brevis.AAC.1
MREKSDTGKLMYATTSEQCGDAVKSLVAELDDSKSSSFGLNCASWVSFPRPFDLADPIAGGTPARARKWPGRPLFKRNV